MQTPSVLMYLIVMAGVTYLIRMIPLVVIKKKITNQYLLSFLHYVPYAVLGAMTFPAVFSATGDLFSACLGVGVALLLAFFEKGLMTVAALSCAAVFVGQFISSLIF